MLTQANPLDYLVNPTAHNALLAAEALKRVFGAQLDGLLPGQIDRLMSGTLETLPEGLATVQQSLEGAIRPLDYLYEATLDPTAFASKLKLDNRVAEMDRYLDWMGVAPSGEQLRSAMRFEYSYMRAIIQGQDLDILNWTLMDDAQALREKAERMKAKARLLDRILTRRLRAKESDAEFRRDWAAYQEFVAQNDAFIEELEVTAQRQMEYKQKFKEAELVIAYLSVAVTKAERLEAEAAQQFSEYTQMTAKDISDSLLESLSSIEQFDLSAEERQKLQEDVEDIITDMSQDYLDAVNDSIKNVGRVLDSRRRMQETHWPEPIENNVSDVFEPALAQTKRKEPGEQTDEDRNVIAHNEAILAEGTEAARGAAWYLSTDDMIKLVDNPEAYDAIVEILKSSNLPHPYPELLENSGLDPIALEKTLRQNSELIEARLACLQTESDPETRRPLTTLQALLYSKGFTWDRLSKIISEHPRVQEVVQALLPPEQQEAFTVYTEARQRVADNVEKHFNESFSPSLDAAMTPEQMKICLSSKDTDLLDLLMSTDNGGSGLSFEEAKAEIIANVNEAKDRFMKAPSDKNFYALMDMMNTSDRDNLSRINNKEMQLFSSEVKAWVAQPENQEALMQGLVQGGDKTLAALHVAETEATAHKRQREQAEIFMAQYNHRKDQAELMGAMKARHKALDKFSQTIKSVVETKRKEKMDKLEQPGDASLSADEENRIRFELAPQAFGQRVNNPELQPMQEQHTKATPRFQDIAKTITNASRFLNRVKQARVEAEEIRVKEQAILENLKGELGLSHLPEELSLVAPLLGLDSFSQVFEATPEIKARLDDFVQGLDSRSSELEAQQLFRDKFSEQLDKMDKSSQVQLQAYLLLKHNLHRVLAEHPEPRDPTQQAAYEKALTKLLKKEAFRKAYMTSFVLRDSLPPELQSPRAIDEEVASIDRRFIKPKQEPSHKALEQEIKDLENDYRLGKLSYEQFKADLDTLLKGTALNNSAEQYLRFRHRQAVLRNTLKKPSLTQEERAEVEKNISELASDMEKANLDDEVKASVEQVGALNDLNGLRLQMDRDMSQANGLLAAMSESPDTPFNPQQEAVAMDLAKRYNDTQAQYAQALEKMQSGKRMMMDTTRPQPSRNQKAINSVLEQVVNSRLALDKHHGQAQGLRAQLDDRLTAVPSELIAQLDHDRPDVQGNWSPEARRIIERLRQNEAPRKESRSFLRPS